MNATTEIKKRETAWYIAHHVVLSTDYCNTQPSEAIFSRGVAGILERMQLLVTDPADEITVLIDQATAKALRLTALRIACRNHDGTTVCPECPEHPVTRSAASAGYKHTKIRDWTTFYPAAKNNPLRTIHIGQLDRVERDYRAWPFWAAWPADTVAALQLWHDTMGIAWQASPPVMGVELLHRTLPHFRIPNIKGQVAATRRSDAGPPDAQEAVWTPEAWSRQIPDVAGEILTRAEMRGVKSIGQLYLHQYDKTRAGITAAGVAKLSPLALQRTGPREFDPKRAGWWLISIPAWNHPNLPHPCGPYVEVWQRKPVCTATMDSLAELAHLGEIDFPEVIDSWTGPARPVMGKWAATLAKPFKTPADRYDEALRGRVCAASKLVGNAGHGMLNNPDSTMYRPDWYWGVNATKRATVWRMAHRIGAQEGRYPVAIDDDGIWYASVHHDPVRAAPAALGLREHDYDPDAPGSWHYEKSRTVRV
jgi:hypothetical protein